MRLKCLTLIFPAIFLAFGFLQAGQDSNTPPPDYTPNEVAWDGSLEPCTLDATGPYFLLIKDVDPWGINANEIVLTVWCIPYDVIPTNQLADWDLTCYDYIIVASDQYTSSYDNLVTNQAKLAVFVNDGGILLAHAADGGYNLGTWNLSWLPGSETHVFNLDETLEITATDHPIVDGIKDTKLDDWHYSTHGYFVDASGSTIIKDDGNPTYVEYPHGSGTVLTTCQTMEWPWIGNGTELLLKNEIEYALSLLRFILPKCNFDSDKNVGLPPLKVLFTDETLNDPIAWSWDLAVNYGGIGSPGAHGPDPD